MTEKEHATKQAWIDPDDGPEWTEDMFRRAEIRDGDKLIRPANGTLTKRGRPPLETPKRQVTLRLDQAVIDRFKQGGPGWQSRINEALKKAIGA